MGEDAAKSYPSPAKTPMKRKATSQMFKPGKKSATKKAALKAAKKQWKAKKKGKVLKKTFKKWKKRSGKRTFNPDTGAYGGKFEVPEKGNLKKQKNLTEMLKNGYHLVQESHGNILDPDCIYIHHSNYMPIEIAKVLTGAIYRKLLRKGGFEVSNMETELPFYSLDDSDGFKIQYATRNPITKAYNIVDHIITNDTNFRQLVEQGQTSGRIGEHLILFMRNANFAEPYRIMLYQSDRNGVATNWRLASELNLECEKVKIDLSSKLVCQNRTKGSGAPEADANVDRVDSQPLKGFIYQFKNADPRLKASSITGTGNTDNGSIVYNSGTFQGVRTYGGSTFPNTGGANALMREPPAAKIWRNIESVSKINLEPGVMKTSYISNSYENYLITLLKKFRMNVSSDPIANFRDVKAGKCQIMALEEVLRTPNDNQIFGAFEVEWRCGAMCTTKKNKSLLLSEFSVPLPIAPVIPT
jgi:hypothetical protein